MRTNPRVERLHRLKGMVIALMVAVVAIAGVMPAIAQEFYHNDFESGDTSGWSTSTPPGSWANPIQIESTPIGNRNFLGQFGKQNVSLTLTGLPAHSLITISFDLYVINTWDGNGEAPSPGPDIFDLSVAGGPTLLHTTFSNANPMISRERQAYPGSYPGGRHPPFTGATEIGTLGYHNGDAVYHLAFPFCHTASSVQFDFEGALTPPDPLLRDESWGLDNVTVTLGQCVDIDVKPGSFPNSINLKDRGVLPIAILTTPDFDAQAVDEDTVRLGDPQLTGTAIPIRSAAEDVDGDGDYDLLLFFRIPDLANGALEANSTEVLLTGETFNGIPIAGIDSVRIVQSRR